MQKAIHDCYIDCCVCWCDGRAQVEILRKQLLVAVVVVVGSLGKGLDIIFGILVKLHCASNALGHNFSVDSR